MALPRRVETSPAPDVRELREIAGRAQPAVRAEQRILPVLPALSPLFPWGGLQRGSIVAVSGSTLLALAVVAGASAAGSWGAAVALPSLGLRAAAELGIALDRFPLVASPYRRQPRWAWVVASLLDAFDVVLGCGSGVSAAEARRLAARARERGSVLVVTQRWPEGADIRLELVSASWHGVGRGHGRLRGRRVEVVGGGRGAAAGERRATLWLPDPHGGVSDG